MTRQRRALFELALSYFDNKMEHAHADQEEAAHLLGFLVGEEIKKPNSYMLIACARAILSKEYVGPDDWKVIPAAVHLFRESLTQALNPRLP